MTDVERLVWQAESYANQTARQRDLYDRVMPAPAAPGDDDDLEAT